MIARLWHRFNAWLAECHAIHFDQIAEKARPNSLCQNAAKRCAERHWAIAADIRRGMVDVE